MTFGPALAFGHGRSDEHVSRQRGAGTPRFLAEGRAGGGRLPFAEDLLAAYYCAFDQATPFRVRAALVGALAYFVMPFDFMPDVLPLLGFTDDAAVLLTALRMVAGHLRPEHRDAARGALERIKAGEG